jgi:uncharacterized protein YkwD
MKKLILVRKVAVGFLILISLTHCQSSSDSPGNLTSGGTETSPVTTTSDPITIPSATPSSNNTLDSEESAFVTLINDYRVANGIAALQVSPLLVTSSKWMSTDMANNNYFSHTDSLGRDPFTRMSAWGYTDYLYAGENIATGSETAQDTFTQWENSSAHNANMLDTNYSWFGVGRAYNSTSTYGWYWTTDFGSNEN